jgi:hypothetical protein
MLVVTPSVLAKPANSAATKRYLAAYEARERAVLAGMPAAVSAARALRTVVIDECAGVAKAAPAGAVTTEAIREEILGSTVVTGESPLDRANVQFAHAVDHLRWTDRTIARLVETFVAEERALAALTPPNICDDVRAWVANQYSAVSAATSDFLSRLHAIEERAKAETRLVPAEEPEEVILRLLRPYESADDKTLVRRVEKLHASLEEHLISLLIPAVEMDKSVGLPA